MIPLPTGDPFVHENNYWLSAQPHRFGKAIAQYELFCRTLDVPGAIVECGVFKGSSFCRWAMLRAMFCDPMAKKLIGFDTFEEYADTRYLADRERDAALRDGVVSKAGTECITTDQLMAVLSAKNSAINVELISGLVEETIPEYLKRNPELKISLLNLDLDFYMGSQMVLTYLWPRVSVGGIMLLDDYGVFEGETRAADELLPGVQIRKFPYAYSPCYVVKA